MSNMSFIAQKYARAYLNSYPKTLSLDSIESLKNCKVFFSQHKSQLYFIHLANIPDEMKNEAIVAMLSKFKLSHLYPLVRLLIEDRRIYFLPHVLGYLREFFLKRSGILEFDVLSSTDLDESAHSVIEKFLEQKTGKKIRAYYLVDESLIAGICLKGKTLKWEFSIRKELSRIKQNEFMV